MEAEQIKEHIPLTEEWLVKFGFVSNAYIDTYELWKDGQLFFLLDIDKTKGFLQVYWSGVELKTVYHLQNLFYALTSQELKLKEECKTA